MSTGQWARPLLVTSLPSGGSFCNANLLFMAWLGRDSLNCGVERLWPDGKALEYDAVLSLLPDLDSSLLRAADNAIRRRHWIKRFTCERPRFEVKVNSPSQFTEVAAFECGGLAADAFNVTATASIVRYEGLWSLSAASAETRGRGQR